jgi:hypothetical protein
VTQPYDTPINNVTVADVEHTAPVTLPVVYARDNLGEDAYDTGRGGPVDEHIDNQQAHPPFYGLDQTPDPYPL